MAIQKPKHVKIKRKLPPKTVPVDKRRSIRAERLLSTMYHARSRRTIKLSMLDVRSFFNRPVEDFEDLRRQGLEWELQERFILFRGNMDKHRTVRPDGSGRLVPEAMANWVRDHEFTRARIEGRAVSPAALAAQPKASEIHKRK